MQKSFFIFKGQQKLLVALNLKSSQSAISKLTTRPTFSVLLYSSETQTIYKDQAKMLERSHQKCPHHILKINWSLLIPDIEVLAEDRITSIQSMLIRNQWQWANHLVYMNEKCIPKQLLYSELMLRKSKNSKRKKRYKSNFEMS